MNTFGSPLWQGVLFSASLLFLVWQVWSGWRKGVVRSFLDFAGFVLSGVVGVLGAQAVAAVWGWFSPGSAWIAGLVAGLLLMFATLGAAIIFSAILFKRTGQQSSGLIRLAYGAGGAFFGLLVGLAFLWGGISIIRTMGAMAASSPRSPSEIPPVQRGLLTLKESLELGSAGRVVEKLDPIPPRTYSQIQRLGELSSSPAAMQRFLDAPGIREIFQHPKMAQLLEDPDVMDAAERRDITALMRSKALLQAASDPSFQKLLTGIDLQKALDYALPPAQSSPSPVRKP